MDAVAAAAAVGALISDEINFSRITPQMREAFHLAFPNMNMSSLVQRTPEELEGIVSAWKGKYFEVLIRDQLNLGEWVGDIHLEPGQTATLAHSLTQPGWDLEILNPDGSIAQELQLKATDSLSYVKEALERYPDIDIITTHDALGSGGEAIHEIIATHLSDGSLEEAIRAPMESLFDSPLHDVVETILPGPPFVIIAVSEGRNVMLGRKSFELAAQDALFRAVKTGAAIGVGALVHFLDGGLLSIPAAYLTRVGLDRYRNMIRLCSLLDKRISTLRALAAPPSTQTLPPARM